MFTQPTNAIFDTVRFGKKWSPEGGDAEPAAVALKTVGPLNANRRDARSGTPQHLSEMPKVVRPRRRVDRRTRGDGPLGSHACHQSRRR